MDVKEIIGACLSRAPRRRGLYGKQALLSTSKCAGRKHPLPLPTHSHSATPMPLLSAGLSRHNPVY